MSRPHDAFCKMLLDRPGNADFLLRERLPPSLVAGLSDKPAVDRSAAYIDFELVRNATDRVYALETIHGEPLLIYTTVEHKSRPGREILIQTLRNLAGIAERAAVERRNPDGSVWLVPAVVIPMVIYNGTRPWTQPIGLSEANRCSDALVALGMLHYRYILLDLFRTQDAELSARPDLKAGLLVLKHAAYDDDPEVTARRVLALALAIDLDFFVRVLRYILGGAGKALDRGRLVAILNQFVPNREDEMLSTAAVELMAEAEEKGRKKGREEGQRSGEAGMLRLALQTRFGGVPEKIEDRISVAETAQLKAWFKRTLQADCLDAIFVDEPKPH